MSLVGHVYLQKGQFVLDSGRFEFPSTGLTAIFGRSGSGKTTFLRALAGFEQAVTGEVIQTVSGGKNADLPFEKSCVWLKNGRSLPVHQRQLGYVFQEPSLFAHLTVEQNLRYGLKRSRPALRIGFEQTVAWLGLGALLARDVVSLSGGEKQRVAIGRTLLAQPTILMMDEPLAALDVFAKRAIMPYLEKLRDELEMPILYITHSPEEVERLADTVVFMAEGKIDSIEPLEQALNRPDTPLYQQADIRAVLATTVAEQCEEDGLTRLSIGAETLWVPAVKQPIGSDLRVVVSAREVSLLAEKPALTSMLNHLNVTIENIEPHTPFSLKITCRMANTPWPLLIQVTKRSAKNLQLAQGQRWVAAIKSVSILN